MTDKRPVPKFWLAVLTIAILAFIFLNLLSV
jgi:hypothetical protein